ncbi:pilus assembly protein PilN [Alginatibacterium sediminis]|uniref:Pilus assembly protein PilN n=1 Tax=Alginatibacterium sediminis TaxID=2164068 RepID=A0A420EKX6_9ALTE|nr:PilN domain-containing protein [Alginatibacterium sediminis]RKF21347.1 pilus assembly protein PilN [Alginatibacterium sediminis]
MSSINLLPWREQAKQRKKTQFWILMGVSAALTLLATVGVQMYFSSLQDVQKQRNQFLRTEIAALDVKLGEIRKINERKKSLRLRIDLIQELQRSRHSLTRMMNTMPEATPAGIYFDTFSYDSKVVKIDGKSESNPRVSSLMRNIESYPWLGTPQISSIVALNAQSGIDLSRFQLSFNVDESKLKVEDIAK